MTQPNQDTTEESADEPIRNWRGFERRPLLKALGAGVTLPLGGGIAAAGGDEPNPWDSGDEDGGGDDDQIDPVFGYPTTDVADIPEGIDPDHEVEMTIAPPADPSQPGFLYFEPPGLRVDSGDIVQFTAETPDHTVTAYHPGIGFEEGRVPEEAEPFSSPVLGPGGAWLYRFEAEGVYDMYCGPHHIMGMVMRLVVGDLAEADVPEYARTVEGLPAAEDISTTINQMSEQNENCEWPFVMPAEILGSDALDPMNIQDMGTVPFSAVADDLGYEFQPIEAQETPPDEEPAEEDTTAEDNVTDGDDDSEGG